MQSQEFVAARSAAEKETPATDPSEFESLVQSLLDAEEARVSEALLFAEILAPLVAERIRPALNLEPVASRAPFPADREPARAATPTPRQPLASGTAPSIADMIDGMLSQERSKPRHA